MFIPLTASTEIYRILERNRWNLLSLSRGNLRNSVPAANAVTSTFHFFHQCAGAEALLERNDETQWLAATLKQKSRSNVLQISMARLWSGITRQCRAQIASE